MLGLATKAFRDARRARSLVFVFVFASTLGAMHGERDARAAPPASNAAALGRFEAGKKAYEGGKFEEALIAFTASQSLLPSPNSRLYIARCYRALGRVASAYTNFRLASREAQDRLGATGEKRYSATRDTAASEAAALEPKVPRLTLAVPSDVPEGFVVKVDGLDVPKAAWGTSTETDPGDHTIDASGSRLAPFSQKVSLKEGAQLRVDVRITRLPTATLALHFATRPAGLALELDGNPLDSSAAEARRELDVGKHRIVVHAPGYKDFTWEKTLEDHGEAMIEVKLDPDLERTGGQGPPKWLFFSAAGGAVVALAVATGIAVHAQSEQRQQLALDSYARDPSIRSSIGSQATAANVLFIAGGVLGIGAAALAVTTHWKSEGASSSAIGFTPWVSTGTAGLGSYGTF